MGLKNRAPTVSRDLFKDGLIIVPLGYLVFKTVNYPGDDDLIPLFPFVGLFAGYAFLVVSRWVGNMIIVRRSEYPARLARWLPLLALPVLAVLAVIHSVNYRITSVTLQDQQVMVQGVEGLLGPDDKIYVHGTLRYWFF